MALNILSRQSTRAAILSGINALASDYSSLLPPLHCCGEEEVMLWPSFALAISFTDCPSAVQRYLS